MKLTGPIDVVRQPLAADHALPRRPAERLAEAIGRLEEAMALLDRARALVRLRSRELEEALEAAHEATADIRSSGIK